MEAEINRVIAKMMNGEEAVDFDAPKVISNTLMGATRRAEAKEARKRFVPPALHIRSVRSFLFCSECFTLKSSGLEITPATILSSFFCPSCQSEASTRFEKAREITNRLKEADEKVLIEELKSNRSSVSEEQVREAIVKMKKEYEEWSDTQVLTGSAYLFSTEDVMAIFAEAQIREFMPKDLELGFEEKRPVSLSEKVSVPLDPYKTLVRQLFMDVHRERVAHNENLEEHITNKGF